MCMPRKLVLAACPPAQSRIRQRTNLQDFARLVRNAQLYEVWAGADYAEAISIITLEAHCQLVSITTTTQIYCRLDHGADFRLRMCLIVGIRLGMHLAGSTRLRIGFKLDNKKAS